MRGADELLELRQDRLGAQQRPTLAAALVGPEEVTRSDPLVDVSALPYTRDMAPDIAQVEQALLALAPDDRAAVIERGLLSLDDVDDTEQVDIDAAWLAEVNRRVDEYVSGDTKLVDADEHFAQIRAKLAAREL